MSTGSCCAGCKEHIYNKYIFVALDKTWHEDCLRCFCCHARLCDSGQKLFYRDGMTLCRQDYIRLYARETDCAACKTTICMNDMVMRAKDKVYHLNCFKCAICSFRFCVGDKFAVHNGQLLCEYDYQEKKLFHMAAFNNDRLQQISKNIRDLAEFEMGENRSN